MVREVWAKYVVFKSSALAILAASSAVCILACDHGHPVVTHPEVGVSGALNLGNYKRLDAAGRRVALNAVLLDRRPADARALTDILLWEPVSGQAFSAALCLGHQPPSERDPIVEARADAILAKHDGDELLATALAGAESGPTQAILGRLASSPRRDVRIAALKALGKTAQATSEIRRIDTSKGPAR